MLLDRRWLLRRRLLLLDWLLSYFGPTIISHRLLLLSLGRIALLRKLLLGWISSLLLRRILSLRRIILLRTDWRVATLLRLRIGVIWLVGDILLHLRGNLLHAGFGMRTRASCRSMGCRRGCTAMLEDIYNGADEGCEEEDADAPISYSFPGKVNSRGDRTKKLRTHTS